MSTLSHRVVVLGLVVLVAVFTWIALNQSERLQDLEQRLADLEVGTLQNVLISVSDVDNTQGQQGQYFLFDPGPLDALLGREGWEGQTFVAVVPESGHSGSLILWAKPLGAYMGYGRWADERHNHGWHKDQRIYLYHSAGRSGSGDE